MSKYKKQKLPPFEQARENLKKMHNNVNLCVSTLLLVESMENFDALHEEDQADMLVLLNATLVSLSSFIEETDGHQWN